LPFVAVCDEVARGTLSFLPIDHAPLVIIHAVASRRDAASVPFVTEVRRLLRDLMSNQAISGEWPGASVTGVPAKAAGFITTPELEAAIE
jgi:hypothetical protein